MFLWNILLGALPLLRPWSASVSETNPPNLGASKLAGQGQYLVWCKDIVTEESMDKCVEQIENSGGNIVHVFRAIYACLVDISDEDATDRAKAFPAKFGEATFVEPDTVLAILGLEKATRPAVSRPIRALSNGPPKKMPTRQEWPIVPPEEANDGLLELLGATRAVASTDNMPDRVFGRKLRPMDHEDGPSMAGLKKLDNQPLDHVIFIDRFMPGEVPDVGLEHEAGDPAENTKPNPRSGSESDSESEDEFEDHITI